MKHWLGMWTFVFLIPFSVFSETSDYCQTHRSFIEGLARNSEALPEFLSSQLAQTDLLLIGETHYEQYGAEFYRHLVSELKNQEGACLLTEFNPRPQSPGTCIVPCMVEPPEGEEARCINRVRWRTSSERAGCHKGQMAGLREAFHGGVPFHFIDEGVRSCGSAYAGVEFLKAITCRDEIMHSRIRELVGKDKPCKKAVMLVGSAHLFDRGEHRTSLLDNLRADHGDLSFRSCLILGRQTSRPDEILYPRNNRDEPRCLSLPAPLGSNFGVDLSRLTQRNLSTSRGSGDGTSYNMSDPDCIFHLGCQNMSHTDCATETLELGSGSTRFTTYPLELGVRGTSAPAGGQTDPGQDQGTE